MRDGRAWARAVAAADPAIRYSPVPPGLRATILGFAREGLALARYLHDHGAVVTVTDRQPASALAAQIAALEGRAVTLHLGGHLTHDFETADAVFVSPGVPKTAPPVTWAQQAGTPLLSETILFFHLCRAPIAGITGSSGKTTTTSLVGEMVRHARPRTHVGGNIGRPLIEQVDTLTPDDIVVLEISSFQLEWLRCSPHWALITNITPNHLDVHGSMDAYITAKSQILRHQLPDDIAILNADDPVSFGLAGLSPARRASFSLAGPVAQGAYAQGECLLLVTDAGAAAFATRSEIRLRGEHNIANLLAAAAMAQAIGASITDIRAVATTFTGVPHRLEPVRTRGGAWYYNDSIATTPERTMAALRAFREPVVLLLGGRDKHLPLEGLVSLARERCRAVICFGEAGPLLARAFGEAGAATGPTVRRVDRLADAVALAPQLAQAGDVVLLSPACTSYDEFRDFEERGATFRALVNAL